jgi:ribonuclease D
MDYFDHTSDSFLKSELIFKRIFNLREELCQHIDTSKKEICEDNDLGILCRVIPQNANDLIKNLDKMSINGRLYEFSPLFAHTILTACSDFPSLR